MKYLILLLFLSTPAYSQIEDDKAAHFGLSAVGAAATIKTYHMFTNVCFSGAFLGGCTAEYSKDITWKNRFISSGIWLGIGYLKERADKNYDKQDMNANILGILTGNLLTARWEL